MAKDRKHADVLGDVLEERIGSRPRLEVRSGEESSGRARLHRRAPEDVPEGPSRGTPPREPAPLREEPPAAGTMRVSIETVARADVTGARSGTPEAGGEVGNGTIRSEAEVFEMVRGFGPFGGGKGS